MPGLRLFGVAVVTAVVFPAGVFFAGVFFTRAFFEGVSLNGDWLLVGCLIDILFTRGVTSTG